MLTYEEASAIWREGERRLARAEGSERDALDRVTREVVDELRRRLGGPFRTQELADLYGDQGTDWILDIAAQAAPGNPAAWDISTVAGAAFARYAREARDYRPTRVERPPGMEPG